MSEQTEPKNVVEALRAVMAAMPAIGKNEQSSQGYSYRGIEQITKVVQPLFAQYGVIFVPHVRRHESKTISVNNKPWTDEVLEVSYTVYGPGGAEDRIEVGPIVGIGRDNSDKGANKAMTQAFKYALLQTLAIGDAKDDGDAERAAEADSHRPEPAPDERAKGRGFDSAQHESAIVEMLAALTESMTAEELKALTQWRADFNLNGEKVRNHHKTIGASLGFIRSGLKTDLSPKDAFALYLEAANGTDEAAPVHSPASKPLAATTPLETDSKASKSTTEANGVKYAKGEEPFE